MEQEVDPLKDARITISGGQLIVNNPDPVTDRGKYFCKARNSFGSIRSRSVGFFVVFTLALVDLGKAGVSKLGLALVQILA